MPTDLALTYPPGSLGTALPWNADGLIPVVTQDASTGELLMFAWADRAALAATLATAQATYFSRSRNRQWRKGETSGHTQAVVEVRVDCDGDCLLYRVEADGPACHTGRRSCFSWRLSADGSITCDREVLE